ncbi:hypothetical protein [Acidithiobacillus sp.]|uniref:hypothetical protein n=1 Tax=Acidithiobacillus sp. TaxID=1872118 RepID=UPI00262D9DB7|nr:hypothetical protein [Acidithiobacillus sp.]MDD2751016.1 hypothetical protein [Acidithiobacillus sp.]MDD5278781.1 hypothetical protein [Acidithiobacillus sp.]
MKNRKKKPISQMQHYWAAHHKIAAQDRAFMEMVTDPVNPITDHDLEALIAKRPEVYGRFSNFIGKLGGALK